VNSRFSPRRQAISSTAQLQLKELPMKTIAHSTIATRFGAICALAVAGALLAGSITPAAAGKHGGGGGKHGHHQPQKPPKNPGPMGPTNPGPIGPVPRPTSEPSTPKPPVVVVVRDHRAPKVDRTTGSGAGGVKVSSTPVVRDQRGKTTTVKVLGQKVVTVTSRGGRR
jgi:hypothetical protein